MITWLTAVCLTLTSTGASAGSFLNFEEDDAPVGELGFSDETSSTLSFEDEELAEESSSSSWLPAARANASLDFKTALDLGFDAPQEMVGEMQLALRMDLVVDLAESWTAAVSPRFLYVQGLSAAGNSRSQWYLPIPEAFIKFRHQGWTVRAGTLTFAWGSSDLVAPIDVLNPRDLRANTIGIGDEIKLPIPAVEVRRAFGRFVLRGVLQPIFTASRFHLAGWDLGAVPASGNSLAATVSDPATVPATWIDLVGDRLVTPQRPSDPALTVAVRASYAHQDLEASLSFIHGYESDPRVFVSPDLQQVLTQLAVSNASGEGIPTDDPSFLLALARLEAASRSDDEEIFFGRYERRTVLGFDGSLVLDPIALKIDVAYSPKRTFYLTDLASVRLATLSTVVGAEYARGEEWSAQLEFFNLSSWGAPASSNILYFEEQQGSREERTLFFPGVAAGISYRPGEGDLSLELGGIYSFVRQDIAVAPRVSWTFAPHHQVSGGALWVDGRSGGLGGAYDGIDQVWASYRLSL